MTQTSQFQEMMLTSPLFFLSQFIVDASIHPDLPSGNIQTAVMVVAEAAAAKILSN